MQVEKKDANIQYSHVGMIDQDHFATDIQWSQTAMETEIPCQLHW